MAEYEGLIRERYRVELAATISNTSSRNVYLNWWNGKIAYVNYACFIKTSDLPIAEYTDLQGDGFLLDGNSWFPLDKSDRAAEWGVFAGIRGQIGKTLKVKITPYYNETLISYGARRQNYINENSSEFIKDTICFEDGEATISIEPVDQYHRAELIFLSKTNVLIISDEKLQDCELILRTNLDPADNSLPESEMSFSFYESDSKIAEALQEAGNGIEIQYCATQDEYFADALYFYLSDKVEYENKVLTVKCVDAVNTLDDVAYYYSSTRHYEEEAISDVYVTGLTNKLKTSYPHCSEPTDYPKFTALTETYDTIYFITENYRELVGTIQNNFAFSCTDKTGETYFAPSFVDAGKPTVRALRNNNGLEIHEKYCADVIDQYERKIATLSKDAYSMTTPSDESETVYSEEGIKNNVYWAEFSDFIVWDIIPDDPVTIITTNCKLLMWTPTTLKLKCTKTGTMSVEAFKTYEAIPDGYESPQKYTNDAGVVNVSDSNSGCYLLGITFTDDAGTEIDLEKMGAETRINRSNHVGSFTWRGDPTVRPRENFTFIRLDGTEMKATIETVTLKHEGGGLTSEITWREGWL